MIAEAVPVAASQYPLLNVFWTTLFVFMWALWLFLVVWVVIDMFRNRDLSGWSKAAWLTCVVFLPYIGVFSYLIVHGSTMGGRDRPVDYGGVSSPSHRSSAPQHNSADQLSKLVELRDSGVIDDAEYASQKAKVLSG